MKEKTDIKQLLDRFHSGTSTPEENRLLQSYLEENNSSLEELARFYWHNETDLLQGNAFESLSKLHNKLGFEKVNENRGRYRILANTILRYAAIFLVGFGLAWFFVYWSSHTSRHLASKPYKVNVGYGSKSTVELPDGSIVTINSGSSLVCDQGFETGQRIVYLKGEAYFEVHKDAKHPFIVKTSSLDIKVYGTHFNVSAYEGENIETTLLEGSVGVYKKDDVNYKFGLMLKPDQKAIYNIQSGNVSLKNVDAGLSAVWKDGKYYFENEPFGSITRKLERNFNVHIIINSEELGKEPYYGLISKNKSIYQLLDIMKAYTHFRYVTRNDSIIITKN